MAILRREQIRRSKERSKVEGTEQLIPNVLPNEREKYDSLLFKRKDRKSAPKRSLDEE